MVALYYLSFVKIDIVISRRSVYFCKETARYQTETRINKAKRIH
jgi:hypothetical protein